MVAILRELVDYGYLPPDYSTPPDETNGETSLLQILERDSLELVGLFSRQPVGPGRAFFPFLSSIRQSADPSTINVVVWFEESAAVLLPVRDLLKGDQLILPSPALPSLNLALPPPDLAETWGDDQWQLVAAHAALAPAAGTDVLARQSDLGPLERQIARLRSMVSGAPGVVLDLARLEFLLLASHCDAARRPRENMASSFPLLTRFGINCRAAPAMGGRTAHEDDRLKAAVFGIADKRLAFGDLMSAVKHDPAARAWQALCFLPPANLCARVRRITDHLIAPHGQLFQANST
jgi:hypothetical protein